jgi:Flp pilus assembly protein TadD
VARFALVRATAVAIACAVALTACAARTRVAPSDTSQPPTAASLASARAALEQGRLEEALAVYRRAVAESSRNVDAYRGRAAVAEIMGEFDEALSALRIAADLDGSAPAFLRVADLAARMGRLQDALTTYARTAPDPAVEPVAALRVFRLMVENGERDRALGIARFRGWVTGGVDHCQRTPTAAVSRETLAVIAVLVHPRTADCGFALAQELTNAGLTRVPRFLLGEIIRHHARAEVRAEAFAFMLHRLPSHDVAPLAEALNVTGYRLDHVHRRADLAIAVYRKAIDADPRVNPNHQRAHKTLGAAALGASQYDEAVEAFHHAVRLNPTDPAAHSGLGRSLLALGRRAEAAAALARAVELAPPEPSDRKLLATLGVQVPVAPSGPAEEPARVVQEVLRLSGMKHGLASVEQLLRRMLADLAGVDAIGDAAVIRPILEREITADRLSTAIAAHFLARFDADRFDRLRTELREPLSRRMTELEMAAADAAPEAIEFHRSAIAPTEEGRERLRLASRIDVTAAITETVLDLAGAVSRGAATVVNDLVPRERRITPDVLAEQRRTLEPAIVASIAFTYRAASLDELNQYIGVLDSDTGRWSSALQREAATRAAELLAETVMRRIITIRRAARRA